MGEYIVKRLLGAIPLMVGISIVIFGILQLIPGGPIAVYLNSPDITGNDIALLKHQFGLDRPMYVQYLSWFGSYATAQWGASYSSGEPVAQLIAERVPATLLLMGASFALALIIAVAGGVYSAIRQYSVMDYSITTCSFLGISLPVFWFGLMLQLIFAVRLHWLPVGGFSGTESWADVPRHLVLPAVTLAIFIAGRWSRFARAGMLEVLNQDYIRVARAKGLSEYRITVRHALKNALMPLVTIVALDLSALVSGAVVTETVFAWPGMGSLLIQSISNVDYPTLLALLMLSSFAIVVSNLLADVAYGAFDPRIVYR
jgi:peptide/nickel transport system permease protein